jgi:hypothetical protein
VSRSTNPPNRRYGPWPEVAVYIGRTNKAVEKLVERGQIPVRRLNRRRIFDLTATNQWLASLPGTTLAEALDWCMGAAKASTCGREARNITTSLGQEGREG